MYLSIVEWGIRYTSLTPLYLCVCAGVSLTGPSERICVHSLWSHTGMVSLLQYKPAVIIEAWSRHISKWAGQMSTNVLNSLHLCVCGHASADGTVWSISCCSRDKRTQTVSSHWPLKSSQQGKWYQIPVWHPLRRKEKDLHWGSSLSVFVHMCDQTWLTWSPLKTPWVCMWYWVLTSMGGGGAMGSLS